MNTNDIPLEVLQLERVRQLREEWKKVNPNKVYLERIYNRCGTPACLAGHASCMPVFIAQGLNVTKNYDFGSTQVDTVFEAFFGSGVWDALFTVRLSPHAVYDNNSANHMCDHELAAYRLDRYLEDHGIGS